jgi:tetratricopeptide (TPR) repeat protein
MKRRARDAATLQRDVEWALENGLPKRELLPMLTRLIESTDRGSDAHLFAKHTLAELILDSEPWRALRLVRDVLAEVEDARAYSVLGIAHTMLGNFRCAAKAYRQALALEPACPWTNHNLGHLLDVAFDRPREALALLRSAYRALPGESELGASYAHALARAERLGEARRVLQKAFGWTEVYADGVLSEWLTLAREHRTGS